MPGAVTEPKTSPWKVTAQNVEERRKFKHNNSRIALPLSNAKIHRPGLYLPTNRTSNCSAGSESTAQLNTTLCDQNSSKTKSSKRADGIKCKGPGDSKNRSETLFSDASGRIVSKLDSTTLRCSCKIAMDATECKKSGNPSEEAGGNVAQTVKLKTVNVNPWRKDGVKAYTARIVEPHLSINDGDKSPKRNLTRLVSLLQECSDVKNCSSAGREGTANRTSSCQADDGKPQLTSQKLLKPGKIFCSHGGVSQDCHMGENCLSGILLVTSKIPSKPWPFRQLPPIEKVPSNKVKSDFSMFERGPRSSTMKKVCHLCEECRNTFRNVSSRVHGPDMESENLTRLKCKLKLKERELLNMEGNFGKTLSSNSNELARDEPTKCKLGEKFTLPKLYLMHHSTATTYHQKARKMRTKMTDSIISASEEYSNATKQRYYKLAKVERLDSASSPRDKLAKNSTKMPKVQGPFSAVLMPTAPLRGFTPLCSTESPMLWRENESDVQCVEQEKEMTIEDRQLGGKIKGKGVEHIVKSQLVVKQTYIS